jgi:flagellar biosynthesis/type III secretory pathway protein FliH
VLENIAKSYENIRKGVGTVMGGKILDYEAKRIRNEGINEGFNKGINEGFNKGITGAVDMLRDIGLDDKSIITKIMEKYNLSQKEAEGYVLTSAVM